MAHPEETNKVAALIIAAAVILFAAWPDKNPSPVNGNAGQNVGAQSPASYANPPGRKVKKAAMLKGVTIIAPVGRWSEEFLSHGAAFIADEKAQVQVRVNGDSNRVYTTGPGLPVNLGPVDFVSFQAVGNAPVPVLIHFK